MIKNINELQKNDKFDYGNKAAVLGQLSVKFKVAQGIALPVIFFDEYLTDNNYPFTYDDYLGKNLEIQSFIRQSDFSYSQKNIIVNKLCKYKYPKLIVRSSAICEDTEKNSMAGMFVSSEVLNKTNDILFAIKECYCSLFTDKVLEYSDDQNLDLSLLKMGVVIQEYIEGIYSGVIFTADTKEHDTNIIFINYVKGKCDGFVGGNAESYYIKIDKETRSVINSNYNDIDKCSVKLPEELIISLIDTALAIEYELGFYSDIEWTYDGNETYILQARPITTLKDQKAIFEVNDNEKDYEWILVESRPLRPLFIDYFNKIFSAHSNGLIRTGYRDKYEVIKCINSYMYLSYREMENKEELRRKAVERLKEMTDKGLAMFDDCCLPQLLAIKNPMDRYIENNENNSDCDIADFLLMSLEYSETSRINHWESVLGETYIDEFHKYLRIIYGNISTEQLYDLIYIKTLKTMEREHLFKISNFFQNNSSLLEILNASTYPLIIYERLKLSKDWNGLNTLIKNYLAIFGMGYAARYKYNLPAYTLWEKPQYVIEQVKKIISLNKDEYSASIIRLQEKKAEVKKHIMETIAEEYREEFEQKLSVAEKTFSAIDNHHYYCEDSDWGYIITALTDAANRLKNNGLIESIDDIYYFNFEEICGLLRKTVSYIDVKKRRIEYNNKLKILAPNKIIPESHKQPEQTEESRTQDLPDIYNNKILKGMASLNKIVQGTILIGPGVPNDITDNCILVVWNGHAGDLFPVINKIKGLIVVGGSPFDHMGIITREMNIPALYYVKDALETLKTGDKVVLDGEKGIVEIIIEG